MCVLEVGGREEQSERENESLKQVPGPARSLMRGSISRPCDHDLEIMI